MNKARSKKARGNMCNWLFCLFVNVQVFAYIVLALAVSQPVYAAVFNCSSGDVSCLISAIETANANGEDDTINLASGTYSLDDNNRFACAYANSGLPVIRSRITIKGASADTTVIDRAGSATFPFRIFCLGHGGYLMLERVTLRGGLLEATNGYGSAILNHSGNLTVNDSLITGNSANVAAIAQTADGTTSIIDSKISDNSTAAGGGGITIFSGDFLIRKSIISGNEGSGVLNSFGNLTIENSIIIHNEAGVAANFGTTSIKGSTIFNNAARDVTGPANPQNVFEIENTIFGSCCGNAYVITSKGHNTYSDTECLHRPGYLYPPILSHDTDLIGNKYRFVVMADSRSPGEPSDDDPPESAVHGPVLTKIMASVKSLSPQPSFILFGGDLVYGYRSYDDVVAQLKAWKKIVDGEMGNGYSNAKIYPVFGGHERNNGTTATDRRQAFRDVFKPVEEGLLGSTCEYFPIGFSGTVCNTNNINLDYDHTVYYCEYKNAGFFILNNDFDDFYNSQPDAHHEIGICQKEWVSSKLATDPQQINFFIHHEPAYPLSRILNYIYRNSDPSEKKASRDDYISRIGSASNTATMIFSGHEHHYTRRLIDSNLLPNLNGSFYEVKAGRTGANDPSEPIRDEELLGVKRGPIREHHYAVLDVEDQITAGVVYAVDENTGATSCIDYFTQPPLLSGPFPGFFADENNNGRPDDCESIAPSLSPAGIDPLDVDGDGIPNMEDLDTGLTPLAIGYGEVAVDLPEEQHPNITLSPLDALLDTDLLLDQQTKPENFNYPFGFVNFEIRGINPKPEVTVTVTFPSAIPTDYEYWVYDTIRSWYSIPIGNHDGDHQITITLTDGGDGDADGQVNAAISHFGGLGAPKPEIINDLVTFELIKSTYSTTTDTSGCIGGEEPEVYIGKFSFDARLRNKSSSPPLSDLTVQVNTLTNGNLLENADENPGGEGAMLTVPKMDGYANGILSPGESVDVHFVICLKEFISFRFFVDVLGTEM